MDAKEHFGFISKRYDSQRRMFIPRFDEFYNAAAAALSANTDSPRAIDLGAGTGIMAQKVLEKFPKAKIKLLDVSDEMLEVAKKRFSGMDNVEYEIDYFSAFGGEKIYDIVVSALAIHHISDAEKIALYGKIFKSLKDGGIFVNAEQVLCETEGELKAAAEAREAILKTRLLTEDAEVARNRGKLDKCATASAQLKWLLEAGFECAECTFRHLDFAVLVAKK